MTLYEIFNKALNKKVEVIGYDFIDACEKMGYNPTDCIIMSTDYLD